MYGFACPIHRYRALITRRIGREFHPCVATSGRGPAIATCWRAIATSNSTDCAPAWSRSPPAVRGAATAPTRSGAMTRVCNPHGAWLALGATPEERRDAYRLLVTAGLSAEEMEAPTRTRAHATTDGLGRRAVQTRNRGTCGAIDADPPCWRTAAIG